MHPTARNLGWPSLGGGANILSSGPPRGVYRSTPISASSISSMLASANLKNIAWRAHGPVVEYEVSLQSMWFKFILTKQIGLPAAMAFDLH